MKGSVVLKIGTRSILICHESLKPRARFECDCAVLVDDDGRWRVPKNRFRPVIRRKQDAPIDLSRVLP